MKKLIIITLCLYVTSAYSDNSLTMVHDEWKMIDYSLKGCTCPKLKHQLEIQREMLNTLLSRFDQLLEEKGLEQKVSKFLEHMKEECVQRCFENKMNEKERFKSDIETKVLSYKGRVSAKELMKIQNMLAQQMQIVEDQMMAIINKAMNDFSLFKCPGGDKKLSFEIGTRSIKIEA